MHPLRFNLVCALLSIAVLFSLVSLSRPEDGPAWQAKRFTQRSAAAIAKLADLNCLRDLPYRIDPADALKQIIRSVQ